MTAYSYLRWLLKRQNISVPELHRRIRKNGNQVNIKSLYRLNEEFQPVERLDTRVVGAICQVLAVPVTAWVVFVTDDELLQRFPEDKQERMDDLLDQNGERELSEEEMNELRGLVRETQELTLHNGHLIVAHVQRLTSTQNSSANHAP